MITGRGSLPMKKLMALILAVTMLAVTTFAMADAGTETSFTRTSKIRIPNLTD